MQPAFTRAQDIPAYIMIKPARLQYMHYDGTNASAISVWLRTNSVIHEVRDSSITFDTAHGALEAWIGDYIVKYETISKWAAMTPTHFKQVTEELV
jgi:hypothetical protein